MGTQGTQLGVGAQGCRYGLSPSLVGALVWADTHRPPGHGDKATKSSRKTVKCYRRCIYVKGNHVAGPRGEMSMNCHMKLSVSV